MEALADLLAMRSSKNAKASIHTYVYMFGYKACIQRIVQIGEGHGDREGCCDGSCSDSEYLHPAA